MPRNSKAADEFEIQRIHGSCDETDKGNIKRESLVFRIAKKIKKEIQETNINENSCSTTMDVKSEQTTNTEFSMLSNGEEAKFENQPSSKENSRSPLKLKIHKSAAKFIADKEVRRTSRRLILRVNKDFIGTDCIKMGRKKKCKKRAPMISKQPEMVRRGRGRPRLNNNRPKAEMEPPSIPKDIGSETVWTLVPKEIIDSEYFKSQILRVHYPDETSQKTKYVSPPLKKLASPEAQRMPLQNRENIAFSAEPSPNSDQDQRLYDRPSSSRPTVIYFKTPKNRSNVRVNPILKEPLAQDNNHLNQIVNSTKQTWDLEYLRRKYSNAVDGPTLGYIYDVSYCDVQKSENLLSDIMSGKKLLITGNNGQRRIVDKSNYRLQTLQIANSDPHNEKRPQGTVNKNISPELKITQEYPDTLFRQVIVDSIKLLYDDDSVLGYT